MKVIPIVFVGLVANYAFSNTENGVHHDSDVTISIPNEVAESDIAAITGFGSCKDAFKLVEQEDIHGSQIEFTEVGATVSSEVLHDRKTCTILIELHKKDGHSIILPSISSSFKKSIHNGKASLALRYRLSGNTGPATIWDFQGDANGVSYLNSSPPKVDIPCGEKAKIKFSVTKTLQKSDLAEEDPSPGIDSYDTVLPNQLGSSETTTSPAEGLVDNLNLKEIFIPKVQYKPCDFVAVEGAVNE